METGCPVKLGRHVWRVVKIDGQYCHVQWNGHSKVIPLQTAELSITTAAPARAKKRREPRPPDGVSQALSECEKPADLVRVAEQHYRVEISDAQAERLLVLPNFGMQRMYVGNIIRTAIKRA